MPHYGDQPTDGDGQTGDFRKKHGDFCPKQGKKWEKVRRFLRKSTPSASALWTKISIRLFIVWRPRQENVPRPSKIQTRRVQKTYACAVLFLSWSKKNQALQRLFSKYKQLHLQSTTSRKHFPSDSHIKTHLIKKTHQKTWLIRNKYYLCT